MSGLNNYGDIKETREKKLQVGGKDWQTVYLHVVTCQACSQPQFGGKYILWAKNVFVLFNLFFR